MTIHMSPQQQEFSASKASAFATYKNFAVGDSSSLFLAWYELNTLLLSNLPGILGFAGRTLLYPTLFNSCGARPAIGRSVVLRNPRCISLGNKVLIDDFAALDVRGSGGSIQLSDHVSIGRYSSIVAKHGQIELGEAVNVGSYCRIATQSKVQIGASTLIGAYSYIGSGNHQVGDGSKPLISREMEIKGGVVIEPHVWIGAGVTILDGVRIGQGAIIGAQSLVREDVAAGATVVGTPARVIYST